MSYQMTPRILASALVLVFSLGLALYGITWYFRRRRTEELLAFITCMGAISLTQAGVIFADLFTAVELQLFWTNFVNAIGVFLTAYSLLWFALAYSGSDLGLTRWTASLVTAHVLLNGAVVALQPEFLYEITGVATQGPTTVAGVTFAQWVFIDRTLKLPFQLFQLYMYTIAIVTGIIFARYVLNNRPHLAAGQSAALMVGIGIPIALNGLIFVGIVPPELNFTIASLGVTSAGFAVAIFRYRLFDPGPVGRQQLVTMMDDPVVMLNTDARVVDSNPAARELVDAPADWQYMPSDAFFAPLSEQIDPTARRLPVDTEIIVDRDDDTRHLDLRISHIRADSSEILGVLVVLRDITDQHEYQRQLEEKTEQLDTLISIVSHDLRNPLSVASGNVELLRQDDDDDRLATVADALDRMEELVEETLQTARQDARQDADLSDLEPVSLSRLTEDSWEMVTTGDETTLEQGEDMVLLGDAERLRTLFENVFRNAVEHNEPPLSIYVGAISTDDGQQDETGFVFEDDGTGIPAEQRDSIFEHGFSTRADGTGLGLSIVADIVEAHGWEIHVSESEDGGARFEVTGVELAPQHHSPS